MEESYDMHSEEDKVFSGKSKKRKLKTPSQLEALEKFYNEHKYPTEEMKSQLAKDLRLSEKQIQGWFCHRRLKDKKLLKEQDPISSIIPDRGSGLRQDSCGSSKHVENRNFDSKEVESQRFHSQDYSHTVLASDIKEQYLLTRNYGGVDDTSSGSSSALRDRSSIQNGDPYDDYHQLGPKNREYMMASGYLYLQENIENPAICAVKMQLGRHYCEDGPPLGVEFQPLPPNAFESPITDPLHEPYYVGDPAPQNPLKIPRGRKESNVGTVYDTYGATVHPNSYLEGAGCRTMWASHHKKRFPSNPLGQRPSFASGQVSDLNSALDMDDDSSCEASEFKNKSHATWSKHSMNAGSDSSMDLRFQYPQHHGGGTCTRVFQRTECFASEDKVHSRRMTKKGNIYEGRRVKKDDENLGHLKMLMKNKRRVGKKLKGEEIRGRDYVMKMSSAEESQWNRPVKGYAGEMPTSFSEDETAGTSSSMD